MLEGGCDSQWVACVRARARVRAPRAQVAGLSLFLHAGAGIAPGGPVTGREQRHRGQQGRGLPERSARPTGRPTSGGSPELKGGVDSAFKYAGTGAGRDRTGTGERRARATATQAGRRNSHRDPQVETANSQQASTSP